MENRELNTTVYMNETACEDKEQELENKPNQDKQSFWNYIDDYFPSIEVNDLLHWFTPIRLELELGNSKPFAEQLEKNNQLSLKLDQLAKNLKTAETRMSRYFQRMEQEKIAKIEAEKKRKEQETIESAKKWDIE